METLKFVGREAELARLRRIKERRVANLIVLRGRRRIGKSRLLAEFGKEMDNLFFCGIPPTKETTAQSQREEFALQLQNLGLPKPEASDWGNLFWYLAKHAEKGKKLIVLDEISWMGDLDPNFLGKLKNVWDMHFSKNPDLILALCGSVSSWIEKNILSSTGFVGRINLDLVLKELPLSACNAFWHPKEERISAYEKFKLLSITGGVPFYLEQINPDLTAEQNIHDLCFSEGGQLVNEFDRIFSDLFSTISNSYKDIIKCLATGPKDSEEVCKMLGKKTGGTYAGYFDDLVKAGFLRRDFTWSLETGKESKLSRFRLSDNYLRFYLKYIEPNRSKIENGLYLSSVHGHQSTWESTLGLQFENLVTHNRLALWRLLQIQPEEVVMDGPFFQKKTARQPGCQIDYMIQTRFQTLYVCEIKFSKNRIGLDVISEMEAKRKRLKMPRSCSFRPVLIHVNGYEESVWGEQYFDKIIDFSQLLVKPELVSSFTM